MSPAVAAARALRALSDARAALARAVALEVQRRADAVHALALCGPEEAAGVLAAEGFADADEVSSAPAVLS